MHGMCAVRGECEAGRGRARRVEVGARPSLPNMPVRSSVPEDHGRFPTYSVLDAATPLLPCQSCKSQTRRRAHGRRGGAALSHPALVSTKAAVFFGLLHPSNLRKYARRRSNLRRGTQARSRVVATPASLHAPDAACCCPHEPAAPCCLRGR